VLTTSSRANPIGSRAIIGGAVRVFDTLILAAGLAFAVLCVLTAAVRLRSPVPLNGMELGFLHHVRRAFEHQPLYPAPSPSFVPFIYTPLYYYASAAAARLWSVDYPALRAVSCASTLASLLIVGQFVRNETRSMRSAVLAACLFAAIYRASGPAFDVAGVDALFVALLLGALYAIRFSAGLQGIAVAAGLTVLAFLAKQAALIVVVPIAVSGLIADRVRGAMFACGVAAGIALSTLLFVSIDGPWYPFYVFRLALHPSRGGSLGLLGLWSHQTSALLSHHLLGVVPVALLAASTLLVKPIREHCPPVARFGAFYLAASAGVFACALASSLIQGSYINAVLPAYAWIAVLFGVATNTLRRMAFARSKAIAVLPLDVLCLSQFLLLAYVPSRLVPATTEFGYPLVVIRQPLSGMPATAEILEWSGATRLEYATAAAVNDVVAGAPREVSRAFQAQLSAAICGATPARPIIVDKMLFDPDWHDVIASEQPDAADLQTPLADLLARCQR